jgi:hypothetical protein
MIEKAVDAIDAAEAVEEELNENDYELTEPETDHAIQDKVDADLGQPQQPTKVMEVEPGCVFEVHQVGADHFEIRRGDRALKSRFKSADDANIALQLFQAHRQQQQKYSNADYIEER